MKKIDLQNFQIFYGLYSIYSAFYVLVLLINLAEVKGIFTANAFNTNEPFYSDLFFRYLQPGYHSWLLIFLIFLIFLNLLYCSNFFIKLLIFLLFYGFNNSYPTTTDGGTTLTTIILMLTIFIKTPPMLKKEVKMESWEIYLSHSAIKAIKFEVIFMYLSAFALKLSAKIWTNGVATYYIFSQYNNNFFSRFILSNDSLVFTASYITMAIQFLYPMSILFKSKYKNFFRFCFFIIITFHLLTWFSIGLFTFFLSTLFANLIFIDFSFLISRGQHVSNYLFSFNDKLFSSSVDI